MKALTNTEIDNYFKGCKEYGGCYSQDELPRQMQNNKAYVVNMQKAADGNGTHWICTYNLNNELVYFDSYGEKHAPINVEKFMKTCKSKKAICRNPVDLQALGTSSCGEYCCYFIDKAIHGRKFSDIIHDFTHNPVINDHVLMAFFGRESFTERTIIKSIKHHKLKGEGIRDVYNYLKRKAAHVVDTVRHVISSGVRNFAPPSVRHFLETHGNNPINAIRVCRKPIMQVIEKVLNVLSFGQYESNKENMQYDRMFHLYLVVHFTSGLVVKVEKSAVVAISASNYDIPHAENVNVNVQPGITLNTMFGNAEKAFTPDRLYIYDSVHQNCQYFVNWMLSASHMMTPELNVFIMQNSEGVMKHLGWLQNIAKTITDASHVADVIVEGKGIHKKRKGKMQKYKIV